MWAGRALRRPWFCASLLLCLGVLSACLFAHRRYAAHLPLPHADETGHVIPAGRMTLDLQRLDLHGFWLKTEQEMNWPFLHPWCLTVFFLVFGMSTEVARASSLVLFSLVPILAYGLSREIAADDRSADGPAWYLGWLAAILVVVSAGLWTFAMIIMTEALGMALTLATLWAFVRALRRDSLTGYVVSGLLAAAAFLAKYNYGVPLMAALLLTGFPNERAGFARLLDRRRLALLTAIGTPALAWALYPFPEKLKAIYGVTLNRDEGLSGVIAWLFYPREFASLASWPLALLLGVAVLASVLQAKSRRLRPIVLCLTITSALLQLHPNKQDRYMYPLVPLVYVLGEVQIWKALHACRDPRRRVWIGTVLWSVVAAALAFTRNPIPQMDEASRDADRLRPGRAALRFIVDATRADKSILFLGTGGEFPHNLLTWELMARQGIEDPRVDNLPFPGGEAAWDERYRRGYPPELTPEYWKQLRPILLERRYDYVVVLCMSEGSPFRPEFQKRWDAWGQNYAALMESQQLYALTAQRDDVAAGLSVRIYEPPRSVGARDPSATAQQLGEHSR